MFIGRVSSGSRQNGHGEGAALWDLGTWTYHWSCQGRGALSHCVGVCWGHGNLVSLAEAAGPPTCWLCPYGRYSWELHTSSPLQWRHVKERHKQTWTKRGERFPGQTAIPLQPQYDFDWVKGAESSVNINMRGWEKFTANSDVIYSLLALFPSRVAHKLSSAELCSSSELGFSTRILLMSSTLSWSSRANSVQKMSQRRSSKWRKYLCRCWYSAHSLVAEMEHCFTVALSTRGRIVCRSNSYGSWQENRKLLVSLAGRHVITLFNRQQGYYALVGHGEIYNKWKQIQYIPDHLPAQLSPSCSAITAIFSSVLSMALIDAAQTRPGIILLYHHYKLSRYKYSQLGEWEPHTHSRFI